MSVPNGINVDEEIAAAVEASIPKVNPGRTTEGVFWCFTHHLPCECGDSYPKEVVELKNAKSKNMVIGGGYGVETCPTTGRKHLQGWMGLQHKCTFQLVKTSFCAKIHWEKMRGSVDQSVEYCSKEGDYHKFGQDAYTMKNPHERSAPGARSDLHEIRDMLKNGKRMAEIAEDHFTDFLRYGNGFRAYRQLVLMAHAIESCFVFWGEAGSGKSWKAKEIIGDSSFYEPAQNNSGLISFESYDGQDYIVLNDFDPKSINVCALKRILDPHNGAMLPGRGVSHPNQAKAVIITSNYNPRTWYAPEEWPALERRMTSLTYCRKSVWENQLSGERFPNPCPHVSASMAPMAATASVQSAQPNQANFQP